jgi:hypothetical protein
VEVALLLLVRTGAEGERPVVPDSPQRNGLWATVSADGDDPIELGGREQGFDASHGGAVTEGSPYLGSIFQ